MKYLPLRLFSLEDRLRALIAAIRQICRSKIMRRNPDAQFSRELKEG